MHHFWNWTNNSIFFRKNGICLNRVCSLIFHSFFRIYTWRIHFKIIRKKSNIPSNFITFIMYYANTMLIVFFNLQYRLSSSIDVFYINYLLHNLGYNQFECALKSKKWRCLILDANLPWFFWNWRSSRTINSFIS